MCSFNWLNSVTVNFRKICQPVLIFTFFMALMFSGHQSLMAEDDLRVPNRKGYGNKISWLTPGMDTGGLRNDFTYFNGINFYATSYWDEKSGKAANLVSYAAVIDLDVHYTNHAGLNRSYDRKGIKDVLFTTWNADPNRGKKSLRPDDVITIGINDEMAFITRMDKKMSKFPPFGPTDEHELGSVHDNIIYNSINNPEIFSDVHYSKNIEENIAYVEVTVDFGKLPFGAVGNNRGFTSPFVGMSLDAIIDTAEDKTNDPWWRLWNQNSNYVHTPVLKLKEGLYAFPYCQISDKPYPGPGYCDNPVYVDFENASLKDGKIDAGSPYISSIEVVNTGSVHATVVDTANPDQNGC